MSVKLKVSQLVDGEYTTVEVDAEMLDHKVHGKTFFVHRKIANDLTSVGEWVVSEFETGGRGSHGNTIEEAIENLHKISANYGELVFVGTINEIRDRYGVINNEIPQPTL